MLEGLYFTRMDASSKRTTEVIKSNQRNLANKSTDHTPKKGRHNILHENPIQGEKPWSEIKHYWIITRYTHNSLSLSIRRPKDYNCYFTTSPLPRVLAAHRSPHSVQQHLENQDEQILYEKVVSSKPSRATLQRKLSMMALEKKGSLSEFFSP